MWEKWRISFSRRSDRQMAERLTDRIHQFYDRLEKLGRRQEALLVWGFFVLRGPRAFIW